MNPLTQKYTNRLKFNRTKIRYYQLVKQNFLKSKIDREELVERNNNLAAAWRYLDLTIESAVRKEI